MTSSIDPQILDYWWFSIGQPAYGRPHASVFLVRNPPRFDFDLTTMDVKMVHANFGDNKLKYLEKKYPLDNLGPDGCIASVVGHKLHYRKVDPFRGFIADMVYMKHLGYKRLLISADDLAMRVHKVRVSVIYPQVSNHYDAPLIVDPALAKGTLKELGYRMERRYDNHQGTKINNDWFEILNTPRRAQRAYDRLKAYVETLK